MALIETSFDGFFLKAAQALQPYLDHVVFIGGCANALYRHHPFASQPAMRPLATFDLDLAAPKKLPVLAGTSLHNALSSAGMRPAPANQRTNKFRTSLGANETLEFLCPLTGVAKKIRDQSPALVDIQQDCTAEALDYLDLLLLHPWNIDLKDVPPLAVVESFSINIPNPASYVMQKVLIRSKRGSTAKRAKDCYYIYETSVLFRNALPTVTDTARQVAGGIPSKWSKDFVRLARETFGHDNAVGIQEALSVAEENGLPVTAAMIYPAIDRFLAAIERGLPTKGHS